MLGDDDLETVTALAQAFETPESETTIETFRDPEGFAVQIASGPDCRSDSRGYWVASPRVARSFILLGRGDREMMVDFLRLVARFEREREPIEFGHTLKTDHPLLASMNLEAVVFLDPSDVIELPSGHRCLWVLPLTRSEYAVKLHEGLTAMFDAIDSSGRDVFALDQRAPSPH